MEKTYNIGYIYNSDITIPTETIEITKNGIHDVSNYAQANVNVESSSGEVELVEIGYEITRAERGAMYGLTTTAKVSDGTKITVNNISYYVYGTCEGDIEIYTVNNLRVKDYTKPLYTHNLIRGFYLSSGASSAYLEYFVYYNPTENLYYFLCDEIPSFNGKSLLPSKTILTVYFPVFVDTIPTNLQSYVFSEETSENEIPFYVTVSGYDRIAKITKFAENIKSVNFIFSQKSGQTTSTFKVEEVTQ